ncbi:MAG: bifunctional 5,10-methylenetetrahydrofolate dehydrogenase/5,10-methenyltetrahydrofolate cyclohydrolase [Candidatus Omnitrophica bacterium]|nr:bifunctional 5,10-methylenetetrahydrofolate dehydrogenase/5,10-methenyltetrahydrofolate cyclohydrolase [Candidatus Omnitrophota bacterium]
MVKEAQLLKGAEIAKQVQEEIKTKLAEIKSKYGESPKLVALQVGAQSASELYVKKQKDTAESLGIQYEFVLMDEKSTEADVIKKVRQLNQDPKIHAIIIQMPMPAHIRGNHILSAVDSHKDAEGVHVDNMGRLVLQTAKVAPCTAIAAVRLAESTGINLFGKEVVLVGQSKIVGRPAAFLLLEHRATITICHTGTAKAGKLEDHVRRAEVLIVAVGKPNMIPGEWVREGAVVIDVGINRVDGKTVGDVDFEGAKKRAAFITPVPGGVGPLTVTMLMKNVVQAYLWQKGEFGDDE